MAVLAITFTSCQAPSADEFCDALARFVGEQLARRTEFVNDMPWQERERLFDQGDIDVCWMCGWPYVQRADLAPERLDLIAAPVMMAPRYLDQPLYFSDVVVHADSRFASFKDLRGAVWAFNEPTSHSGCNVVRYYLAGQKLYGGFFRSLVESGSHEASIRLILSGAVDGSAIDSTVLETILQRQPEIRPLLRVISTLGPSPAPPWVIRSSLPASLRAAVRKAFLGMHENAWGRAVLRRAAVDRFEAVEDSYYDSIRRMASSAAQAAL